MKLRSYQEEISTQAAEKLREFGLCYLSMECRTGKTITALSAASKYGAKSVLFVTKKKAIKGIQSDTNIIRNSTPSIDVNVINYESAHKAQGQYDLVVLDEAHSIGAFPRPSQRAEKIKELCVGLPVIYLSGTPSPESYSQLYHQFWVCSNSPFKGYKNFYKWAKDYVDIKKLRVNGYDLNDYSHAIKEKIDEATGHLFISYSQDEAGFACHIDESILTVQMKLRTAEYFATLKKHRILTIGDEPTVCDSPSVLLTKLHQLSSGTIITESGKHLIVDDSKATFIKEHFAGEKIAIFYVYQSEFELLKSVFPNHTTSPEEFQASSDKVFVGQVRSAREGIRLDSAEALIFLNLEYSYLSYEQGRNRLSSLEREHPAQVYFLCSHFGIESSILEAVHGKKDFTLSYYAKKEGIRK